MKRAVVLFIILLLWPAAAFCAEVTVPVVEYDLSQWDEIYGELPREAKDVLRGQSIRELITAYQSNASGILDVQALKDVLLSAVKGSAQGLMGVLGTALFCSMGEILLGGNRSMGKMLIFCLTGLCIYGIVSVVCAQFESGMEAIAGITRVTQAVSPVIITLLTACGSVGTATTVQPGAVLLCSAISQFFKEVILPLTLVYCALATAGCITGQRQLKSTAGLIKTAVKWCIGAAITFFLGSVSIRAINGAGLDNAGIKTLKYAVDKSIPVVGGVITGAYESLRGGAVVLKNAAGTAAMLLGLVTVIVPAMRMLATIIALKVLSCLCAVAADGQISGMLDVASDSCTYMFAVCAAITVMNLVIIAAALLSSGGL